MRIQKGSTAELVLKALAVCGEISYKSIDVIGGDHKWIQRTVRALEQAGYVSRVNQNPNRAVHLLAKGLEIIKARYSDYYNQYEYISEGRLQTDYTHLWKRHRLAEVMILMKQAGVGVMINERPILCTKIGLENKSAIGIPNWFYSSREIKNTEDDIERDVRSAQMTGLYVNQNGIFAVYHTAGGSACYKNYNESKLRVLIRSLARPNGWKTYGDLDTLKMQTILFGNDSNAAIAILTENFKKGKKINAIRLGDGMLTAHFIPLNDDGVKLLEILAQPGYYDHFLDLLFDESIETDRSRMRIQADAYDRASGKYYICFLDSDLKKLFSVARYTAELQMPQAALSIICFRWQEPIARSALPNAEIKTVNERFLQQFWEVIQAQVVISD